MSGGGFGVLAVRMTERSGASAGGAEAITSAARSVANIGPANVSGAEAAASAVSPDETSFTEEVERRAQMHRRYAELKPAGRPGAEYRATRAPCPRPSPPS